MEASCQTEIRFEILPLEMLLALTNEMKGAKYVFPSTSLGRNIVRFHIRGETGALSQLSAWLISSQFVNPPGTAIHRTPPLLIIAPQGPKAMPRASFEMHAHEVCAPDILA
jgi:hypothetical protein